MESLNELKEALGLIKHDNERDDGYGKGWYYEDNKCFENPQESISRIGAIIYKILDNRTTLEYIIQNFSVFEHAINDHAIRRDEKINIDTIDDIYEAIPEKEKWFTYQESQQFKHDSWVWITSMACSLIMRIYH